MALPEAKAVGPGLGPPAARAVTEFSRLICRQCDEQRIRECRLRNCIPAPQPSLAAGRDRLARCPPAARRRRRPGRSPLGGSRTARITDRQDVAANRYRKVGKDCQLKAPETASSVSCLKCRQPYSCHREADRLHSHSADQTDSDAHGCVCRGRRRLGVASRSLAGLESRPADGRRPRRE